jgi:hypothetical protein
MPGDSFLTILRQIVSLFTDVDQALMGHLKRDSEYLQTQWSQYANISGDFDTVFFYETLDTKIYGSRREVVTSLVF